MSKLGALRILIAIPLLPLAACKSEETRELCVISADCPLGQVVDSGAIVDEGSPAVEGTDAAAGWDADTDPRGEDAQATADDAAVSPADASSLPPEVDAGLVCPPGTELYGTECREVEALYDNYEAEPLDVTYTNIPWAGSPITYRIEAPSGGVDGLTEARARDAIRRAFETWADAAALTFSENTSGGANIVLQWRVLAGHHGGDRMWLGPCGVLAHAFLPGDPTVIARGSGEIHFDDAELWIDRAGGPAGCATTGVDLEAVALHEIGHALGLPHSSDASTVMFATFTGRRTLAPGDVQAIGMLYPGCTDVDQDGYFADCSPFDCDDVEPGRNPGAAEVCDGTDNNCDAAVDEGVASVCTNYSTCRTFSSCGVCSAPPAESCNGSDDDCDGQIDEGLSRACQSACGSGVQTCASGQWGACSAPQPGVESCNNTDDDCDGQIDESLTMPCSTACGNGMQTCASGQWGVCSARQPVIESCNNTDDDCDGQIDESLTMPCSTACGSGMVSCSAGSWGSCSAVQPSPETCNNRDDDCDGSIDEGALCGSGQTCSSGACIICNPKYIELGTTRYTGNTGCAHYSGGTYVCLDNNDYTAAAFFGSFSDSGNSTRFRVGGGSFPLSTGDDFDWYYLDVADNAFASLDPYIELATTSSDDTNLLVEFHCLGGANVQLTATHQGTCNVVASGSTNFVQCTSSRGGSATERIHFEHNCLGTLSDDGRMFIRVERRSASACLFAYDLYAHF